MDAASLRRMALARKSPFTPKDMRSRCEECQRVLDDRDLRSYWDGDPELEREHAVPRTCEGCAEEAECKSV
jgi:hypothetical protein